MTNQRFIIKPPCHPSGLFACIAVQKGKGDTWWVFGFFSETKTGLRIFETSQVACAKMRRIEDDPEPIDNFKSWSGSITPS